MSAAVKVRQTIFKSWLVYASDGCGCQLGSYTATLNDKRVREKVMEEAEELTEAEGKEEVVWEAADVLYFISVLMYKEHVTWQDIYDELDKRHKEK
jgi:phosphoribosyl-ATP pyrophosphohydrolase/phosphoribosyl-AMP cyclohydrolase